MPHRKPDLPASAPIHQLATLDLLAAFLRHADPLLGEGLMAWAPERACGQLFDGFLRPDALAVIRVRDRLIALFVERDLGSERGEALGEKIRRYRLVFAREPELPINVGFIVESERRARTVHTQAEGRGGPAVGVTVLTAIDDRLRRDPLGDTGPTAAARDRPETCRVSPPRPPRRSCRPDASRTATRSPPSTTERPRYFRPCRPTCDRDGAAMCWIVTTFASFGKRCSPSHSSPRSRSVLEQASVTYPATRQRPRG